MKHKSKKLKTSTALSLTLTMLLASAAYAAPSGGQVVGGQAQISQSGNTTNINQSSQHTQINWQQFNIAKGEIVNFVQPNLNAVALNKVLGNNPSAIYGALNANGKVFLVNPNGILFGKTAAVNVGGLVASTLDIKSIDNGKYIFAGSGGTLTNEGSITARGNIVMVANIVNNQGTIINHGGTTQLVAAEQITLDTGEAYKLTVDKGALNAQINNGGAIYGNDGRIYLTAQGRDALSKAVINHTGVIEANAAAQGAGGTIILLSDMQTGTTKVAGTLNAQGTTGGGFIETSGAKVQVADTAKISTMSRDGEVGTWLIDPTDFTIAAGLADTASGISGTALSGKLNSNNVTITTQATGTGNGDIFVNDAVSWMANNKLTLSAYRNIEINSPIIATTGSVALHYGQGATDGIINGTAATYNIYMREGYKPGQGRIDLSAGENFSTKLGSAGTEQVYTVITALGAAGDEGKTTANSLQGLANSGKLSGDYVLGEDINAEATKEWNSGAGFTSIGDNITGFKGSFDGLGHIISGLSIEKPLYSGGSGLFGAVTQSVISNVGLVNSMIRASAYVGALVGIQHQSNINNAYAKGVVDGTGNGNYKVCTGGLVGHQFYGNITNAYATGTVNGRDDVGGLVGAQRDSAGISNAYADCAVTADDNAGGLVGSQTGTISNVYAMGKVVGKGDSNYGANIGGLVGLQNSGDITNAYATGSVSITNSNVQQMVNVGGLVGLQNSGYITNAYATGAVSVTGNTSKYSSFIVGGLVGSQLYGSIQNAYATGAVGVTDNTSKQYGDVWVGGLVGFQNRSINNAYATGAVSASGNTVPTGKYVAAGGLVGLKNYSITNTYWDVSTAGQADAVGCDNYHRGTVGAVGGDKSAFAQASYQDATAGALDFTNTWYMIEGETRPLLKAFQATKAADGKYHITNLQQLQDMSFDLSGNYVLDKNIDATATANADTDRSSVWSRKCFSPIGNDKNKFTGSFDGQGHTISGLTIRRPSQNYVGLFGYVEGAVISNVGLVGVTRYDPISGNDNVGSLVGYSSNGNITNAYATGTVSGRNNIGGLVGSQNGGSISNAYVTGMVNGSSTVGGLVGSQTGGSINNAYATGEVNGSSTVGGLVGSQTGGSISASYWNTETTGQSASAGSGATGLTTAQMKTAAAFTNWDLDTVGGSANIWRIYEGQSTPLLKTFLKTMTVTAEVAATVYNGQEQTAAFNNIKYNGGAADDKIQGTLSLSSKGTNAGSYDVNFGGLYSSQDGYDIVNGISEKFVINKADLTITAHDQNRISGSLPFKFNGTEFSTNGLIGGEQIDSATLTSKGAEFNAAPGRYAVNISDAVGSKGFDTNNYNIQYRSGTMLVMPQRYYPTAYPKQTLSPNYTTVYISDDLTKYGIFKELPTITIISGGINLEGLQYWK